MNSTASKKSASVKDSAKTRSSGSPGSSGAVSGRASKKSAAGKESAKAASGKSAAAKKAPKKKRGRKKKSSGKIKALTAAFAAGLLAATLALWFWRGMPLPELPFAFNAGQEQVTAKAPAGPTQAAKATAAKKDRDASPKNSPPGKGRDGLGGQKAQSPPQGAGYATSAASAPSPAASASAPAGQKAPQTKNEPPEESRVSSAVASALIDLQSLPYEESLHASLDERIRQVDYALMQAAWMCGLPARALRLAALEDRLEGVEPYQFQHIDILPGSDVRAFAAAFKDCLAAWAEGATLSSKGGNVFVVSIGEVQTHSIRLYPGRKDFLPLPGGAGPGGKAGGGGSGADKGQPQARQEAARPLPKTPLPRVRAGHEAPRLVIVIDDLGASPAALQQLLALDFPVTMAFWPHGAHSKEGALAAHAKGREIIVHQPMEPLGYPKVRPGPNVLLSGMSEARIRKAVAEGIAAVPHAVGLNNHMGSRFTQSREGVSAVIRLLKERGLFMLDSLTDSRSVFADQGRRMGINYYRRNVFLDVEHSREAVLAALKRAERIALLSGQAVAIGHPLPETLAGLKAWQKQRNKEVRIVRLQDLAQE